MSSEATNAKQLRTSGVLKRILGPFTRNVLIMKDLFCHNGTHQRGVDTGKVRLIVLRHLNYSHILFPDPL